MLGHGSKFRNTVFILFVLVFITTACSSPFKRRATSNPSAGNAAEKEVAGPVNPSRAGEVFGPFPTTAVQPLPGPEAPAELMSNPDKIVLVLGRGLTHGYSYVGVLKALHELKIPIHSIYATEVGALVGALYFTQPNPNRIDWALLRFTEKNLRYPEGTFSFRIKSPETDLSENLKDIFGSTRIEALEDKLHITLEDAKSGEALEAKSGELWRAVRGALAGVNKFSPEEFEGRTVKASAKKLSEEYRVARQNEKYPVVVISAGGTPPELFRKLVESQKATLISIPLTGVNDLDLKKRNQAVFAGKNAVHQAANELLGLVGRKLE